MPNQKGGKNYKKSKQTGSIVKPFIEKANDQLYARVLRNLGGRNMLVYCNDNKIRLCHICGAMKKFNWLNVGDLVLVSLRGFEKKVEAGARDKYEKGDILAKYEQDHYSTLKKQSDINPKLFMQLETLDGKVLAEIGDKDLTSQSLMPDDDAIEFVRDDDEEKKPVKKEEPKKEEEEKDINIDDI